jgi:PAS domain S-box-containing protein
MLNTLASQSLPLQLDEGERLDVLGRIKLAGTPAGAAYDTLAEAARQLTGSACALVSLVDAHDTWHVASAGLDVRRSPRAQSFCTHAIGRSGFFEVPDLSADPRFAEHALVTGEPALRRYAAAALVVDGSTLGTLCVMDPTPGQLGPVARQHLERLAGVVSEMLGQRARCLELEERSERLRDLARASGDWAWELDADLRWRWLSAEFEASTGLPSQQVLGETVGADPVVDANGRDLQPPVLLRALLAERQPFSRVIARLQTPLGARLFSHSALPVFGPQGEFRGYRGNARDVTTRVERELLLRDKAALEDISRAKSEFLSRVSHELRTPLNAILGFAQLMALDGDAPLSAQQSHRLDGVRRSGEHLLEMINDVLDIAHIEQGTVSMRPRSLHLGELVAGCMKGVQPLASARPVALHSHVPEDLHVWADAHALEQALLNLLSNAIKFNRPHGHVDVNARLAGGRVMLTVTDTGSGLDEQEQAQLFQPFNRLGAERKRIEGSGLGLVIVRELVHAMGGEVQVVSHPGQGSSFSMLLPPAAAGETPAAMRQTARAAPEPCSAPRQILYIEDEPLNVLLMQEVFRAQPAWTLHVAEEGVLGVEAALRLQPDLTLIDMNLPDIHGMEVLRRLRGHPDTRGLRCVALSADAMEDQIQAARTAGFDDYWTKPIDLNRLLRSVADAIERPPAH